MSARREQTCGCCDGTGEVPDIDGKPRPCSRCRADDFNAWYNARRPTAGKAEPQASTANTGDDGSAA